MKSNQDHVELIKNNGWKIDQEFWSKVSPYSQQFMIDELTGFGSYSYYEDRLKAIGFLGKEKVLDAACGNAQWSIVMSHHGSDVYGIDLNEDSVSVAKDFVKINNANPKISVGSIDDLPFEDESFDAVVCYSAIMYTDFYKTLKEFNRVLKKGGHAYISTDSIGWLVHLLVDKGIRKFDFDAIKRYSRRIYYKVKNERAGKTKDVVIMRKLFKKIINDAGFNLIAIEKEGRINNFDKAPASRYPVRYYGFETIIDVLIEKR